MDPRPVHGASRLAPKEEARSEVVPRPSRSTAPLGVTRARPPAAKQEPEESQPPGPSKRVEAPASASTREQVETSDTTPAVPLIPVARPESRVLLTDPLVGPSTVLPPENGTPPQEQVDPIETFKSQARRVEPSHGLSPGLNEPVPVIAPETFLHDTVGPAASIEAADTSRTASEVVAPKTSVASSKSVESSEEQADGPVVRPRFVGKSSLPPARPGLEERSSVPAQPQIRVRIGRVEVRPTVTPAEMETRRGRRPRGFDEYTLARSYLDRSWY